MPPKKKHCNIIKGHNFLLKLTNLCPKPSSSLVPPNLPRPPFFVAETGCWRKIRPRPSPLPVEVLVCRSARSPEGEANCGTANPGCKRAFGRQNHVVCFVNFTQVTKRLKTPICVFFFFYVALWMIQLKFQILKVALKF